MQNGEGGTCLVEEQKVQRIAAENLGVSQKQQDQRTEQCEGKRAQGHVELVKDLRTLLFSY